MATNPKTTSRPKPTTPTKLSNPIPLRLGNVMVAQLAALCSKTGLPRAFLLRAALNHSLPKMIAGDIDVLEAGKGA